MTKNKQSKKKYKVVFLDKTARNAAYIFRLVWAKLEQQGEIPEGVKMPKIRFINVGTEESLEHKENLVRERLKETYREEDFVEGRVVIVDEFWGYW